METFNLDCHIIRLSPLRFVIIQSNDKDFSLSSSRDLSLLKVRFLFIASTKIATPLAKFNFIVRTLHFCWQQESTTRHIIYDLSYAMVWLSAWKKF